MLSVLIPEGFPVTAQEYLSTAVQSAFGGMASIVDVPKDKLKTRVRLGGRDASVSLVVLDKESEELCREVENGLYISDKYLRYESIPQFVKALNEKYGLSMEYEEEENVGDVLDICGDTESGGVSQEEVDRIIAEKDAAREAIVLAKDRKIRELESRIKELEIYQFKYEDYLASSEGMGEPESEVPSKDVVSKEDYDALLEQNQELQGSLMDIQAELSTAKGRIKVLESSIQEDSVSDSKMAKQFEDARRELSDLRNTCTQQSALITKKNSRIDTLTEEVDKERSLRQASDNSVTALSSTLSDLRADLKSVKVDNESKDREISRLYRELGEARSKEVPSSVIDEKNSVIDDLKAELTSLTEEYSDYKKSTGSLESTIESQGSTITSLETKISNLESQIEEKDKLIGEQSETINKANSELIELNSKLEYYEKGASLGESESSLEYTKLKKELIKLQGSIFYRLSEESSESSPFEKSNLLPNMSVNEKFKKISFVFAGSQESVAGTYKNFYSFVEPIIKKNRNVLFVDLFSDTVIDSEECASIQGKSMMRSGSTWFRSGGNVQSYLLTSTKAKNVKVLSVGISYSNELFLLNVDWESRLKELELSGYSVYIFCGSISSMMGRLFHCSFASHGNSYIFTRGDKISCLRSLIAARNGFKNFTYSKLIFFNFKMDTNGRHYLKLLEKSNECKVFSVRKQME